MFPPTFLSQGAAELLLVVADGGAADLVLGVAVLLVAAAMKIDKRNMYIYCIIYPCIGLTATPIYLGQNLSVENVLPEVVVVVVAGRRPNVASAFDRDSLPILQRPVKLFGSGGRPCVIPLVLVIVLLIAFHININKLYIAVINRYI